jgi:lsr operon transcriptional repressor
VVINLDYEQNLIFKIAWFYYMENMTQQEISEELDMSRMKVVKCLEKARSQGIVQFKLRSDGEKRIQIERQLIEKYNLKDVFVIPTPDSSLNEAALNESISKAAAQYIEANLPIDSYINFGYGDTVSRTINNLIFSLDRPISLVALSGGVSWYTSSIAGANKSDYSKPIPKIYLVPAPLIVSSEKMADALMEEKSVKEILNMTALSYMTVVGIGAMDESATIFRENMITNNDLTLLKMNGAVGDILSQFYDKDGNILESDLHKRLVCTQIDTLKNMSNVLGLAGGQSKVQAIHSALIGGYLDILVTDENTAESLLNFQNA